MKQYYFVLFFVLFILLCACQADVNPTSTAVAEEPSLSDVVIVVSRETATATTIEDMLEPTAVPTKTATVFATPAPITTSETNSVAPTMTAAMMLPPTRTSTPLAVLPSGERVQFPVVILP